MPVTKLLLALAGILGLLILWKMLRIEQMIKHMQQCLFFHESSLLQYATSKEARRAMAGKWRQKTDADSK